MIAEAIDKIIEKYHPEPPTFKDQHGIERNQNGKVLTRPTTKTTLGSSLESVIEIVNLQNDPVVIECSYEHVTVSCKEDFNYCKFDKNIHQASPILPEDFPFGRELDPEMFIIRVSDFFERDDNFDEMISAMSCITDIQETVTSNDGISQTVTYKSGINRKESGKLEPFVNLRAFRTFREVEQPQNMYLLRLTKGKDNPLIALHEASGYEWKQKCAESVFKYVKNGINDQHIVIW